MKLQLTTLAIVVLTTSAVWGGDAVSSNKVWNFEKDEVNKNADGFYYDETGDASKSKWQVVQESDKADSNKVLCQSAKISGETPYALAVVDHSRYEDIALDVRIRAGAGKKKPRAGVVWRYRNSENYLVACIDFSGQRVRLYRVVNGNRVMFGCGEKMKVDVQDWYTLRVEHRGDRIKVYLDNEAFIIAKDKHYRKAGKIGLWSQTGSATFFDDLQVERLKRHE